MSKSNNLALSVFQFYKYLLDYGMHYESFIQTYFLFCLYLSNISMLPMDQLKSLMKYMLGYIQLLQSFRWYVTKGHLLSNDK